MFHVEFLVDDKHLVKMHHALNGLKLFNLDVKPVINAKRVKNKVVEENLGSLRDRLPLAIAETYKRGTHITRTDIFDVIKGIGAAPSSELIAVLVKKKAIKRVRRNNYVVM